MTNDEIAERIKFVTMDEEDGVPGARFAREMAEEVLKLRAELALLRPLAEAAVAYHELLNDGHRMTEAKENELDRRVDHMAITGEAYAAARAQAQAGEGA